MIAETDCCDHIWREIGFEMRAWATLSYELKIVLDNCVLYRPFLLPNVYFHIWGYFNDHLHYVSSTMTEK
jgi:hypothetical protein